MAPRLIVTEVSAKKIRGAAAGQRRIHTYLEAGVPALIKQIRHHIAASTIANESVATAAVFVSTADGYPFLLIVDAISAGQMNQRFRFESANLASKMLPASSYKVRQTDPISEIPQ